MSIFNRLKNIIRSNINDLIEDRKSTPDLEYLYNDTSYTFTEQNLEIHSLNYQEAQYYANLELQYGASYTEIKQSYRTLLKKYHPDLHNKNAEDKAYAEKITQKLNEAFNYFEDKFNRGELK